MNIVCLASCGGDGITPVSEKIQGPLGQYFEVVSKDYKVKDGKVGIEIKRIKEGFPEPWTEGMEVGYSDGEMEPQFTAEFQDADGSVISKDKTDKIWDKDELSAIAALGVDETASITFDVSEDAAQVKIGSTFKVNGEVESTINLSGNIGKYPIQMTMHIASNGEVTGAYYYKSNGPGNYLYVKGNKDGNQIILDEYTKEGEHTGEYTGSFTNNVYKGIFKAMSGEYQFTLSPDKDMHGIDLSTVRFSDFSYSTPINMDDDWSDAAQLDAYITDLCGNVNSLTLALFEGDKMVALSMGYIKHWYRGTEYIINELCVKTEKQHQGIGTEFLHQIEDYLKANDLKAIYLLTERTVPAYNFYKKNGF